MASGSVDSCTGNQRPRLQDQVRARRPPAGRCGSRAWRGGPAAAPPGPSPRISFQASGLSAHLQSSLGFVFSADLGPGRSWTLAFSEKFEEPPLLGRSLVTGTSNRDPAELAVTRHGGSGRSFRQWENPEVEIS